jgi:hypothetical protein
MRCSAVGVICLGELSAGPGFRSWCGTPVIGPVGFGEFNEDLMGHRARLRFLTGASRIGAALDQRRARQEAVRQAATADGVTPSLTRRCQFPSHEGLCDRRPGPCLSSEGGATPNPVRNRGRSRYRRTPCARECSFSPPAAGDALPRSIRCLHAPCPNDCEESQAHAEGGGAPLLSAQRP